MNSIEKELINDMAEFQYAPLNHALYSYPWGKGELEKSPGPRTWQADVLKIIGQQLKKKRKMKSRVVKIAVASGSDIGKTALIAMIIKWGEDTFEGCKATVTANTGAQLRTRTWPELAKWHRMSMTSDWFDINATSFVSTQEDQRLEWRADIAVWRENRTEAFAGFHNYDKRILIIFDEASGIPLAIWHTADTFCLDENTEIIFIAFGNPTQSSGGFFDIFHKDRHISGKHLLAQKDPDPFNGWITFQIDSRTVEGTNKAEIETKIDKYGEDGDWTRVYVKGEFPRASSLQFIPTDWVTKARARRGEATQYHPLICGIDLASGGEDDCVFYFRRGFDGKSIKPIIIPGAEVHDATRIIDKGIQLFREYEPDAIFGDKGGLGKPILDMWRKLGYNIIPVGFGNENVQDEEAYADKASEMGADCKEWLKEGGAVWDDPRIEEDLCNREFSHDKRGRLVLESKKDMKKRGLSSPDVGDALFLTFAHDVAMKQALMEQLRNGGGSRMQTGLDKYKFLDGKKRVR